MKAIKKGIFSNRVSLRDDEQEVGELAMKWFGEEGELTVDGVGFELYRERAFSGSFVMARGEEMFAEASKPSAWRSTFEITFGDTTCVMKKKGAFSSKFVLEYRGEEIGRITRKGVFSQVMSVEVPEGWPRALQAFLLWLALIVWRREANAAATGG